jgi:cell division protein ZapA
MGQVVVKVNGRDFALSCPDGQEPRIRRLAQYVDAKIGEFVGTVGQVGDARLLLLAALVITDELSDANEALQQERSRTRGPGGPGGGAAGGLGGESPEATKAIDAAASGIRSVAQRIESIAARIETS